MLLTCETAPLGAVFVYVEHDSLLDRFLLCVVATSFQVYEALQSQRGDTVNG